MAAKSLRSYIVASSLLVALSANAKDNDAKLCAEFLGHLNQRVGLSAYALQEQDTGKEDPNRSIPNVDIDQDNKDDHCTELRPVSGRGRHVALPEYRFRL